MFMDFRGEWPGGPPDPPPAPRRLSPRGERVIGWLLLVNVVLLLLAPIAGASIIAALVKLLAG